MSYYPPREQRPYPQRRATGCSPFQVRFAIAIVIVLFSVISYTARSAPNPVTGENQRVGSISVDQEIQMGLSARDQMVYQHGGASDDPVARQNVQMMGERLVYRLNQVLERQGRRNPYRFHFHLLNDSRVVNAFALPGGQVFITEALYYKMDHNDRDAGGGQLAGVLGHEIGHVLERHSAQQIAKGQLLQGLVGAAGVAGGDISSAQAAQMIGDMINMKYGRDDELEADKWGVQLMVMLGFHPRHMLEVMDILEESAGAGGTPEILSTHPLPENRKEHIEMLVREQFPDGLPPGLR